MYVLYGLRKCACEIEKYKVATFSEESLAQQYAEFSETRSSKKLKHWNNCDRKYYKWSLLKHYQGHEIDWEDDDEVPHNPSPVGYEND